MTESWRGGLRAARRKVGLTQRRIAELANLSTATIRGYETGSRRPRREHLVAILDALKIDRGERNTILEAAGFAPDGLVLRPDVKDAVFSVGEATEEIERYQWPAFLLDEHGQVLAANQVIQRLWAIDLDAEFADPIARHLLSVASNPRFADRCVNWDEVASIMAAGWRDHHRGSENVEAPSPYLSAVLERFMQGDPKYVSRFFDLWRTAPPVRYKMRWSYPVIWNEPEVGIMRFHCFVSAANELQGYAFNDWIPVDAPTWLALGKLAAR